MKLGEAALVWLIYYSTDRPFILTELGIYPLHTISFTL